MFHISKKNKRAVCRAVVYGCPLGGEKTLFDSFGLYGPVRPTVSEAKDSEVFDKFYGEEKEKQDRYKKKRQEKRKSKSETLKDENSLAYLVKLDEVKDSINSHNDKYSDYLDNSYGHYLMANQKVSSQDLEFLDSLNNIGDSVGALVAEKMTGNTDAVKDREEYEAGLAEAEKNIESIRVKRDAEFDTLTNDYRAGKMLYSQYSRSWDGINKKYRPIINEVEAEKNKVVSDYMVKYENSYGKAYKESLSDLGVSFADRDVADSIISNGDSVDEEFKNEFADSVSYYPDSWVSNVDSDLTVNRYGGNGSVRGYVSHKEGRYYVEGGKKVKLFSADRSTTVHEFGHVLEINNRNIGRAERIFLLSEKSHSSFKKVEKVSKHQNVLTDSLVRKYSGVYYSGGSRKSDAYEGNTYEVFTTGVQNLFTADQGGFTTDSDCKAYRHRNFILGLFATA